MSAPVTIWSDQPNINPTLLYNDASTLYNDPTVFYDGFDPSKYDPLPLSWTDET